MAHISAKHIKYGVTALIALVFGVFIYKFHDDFRVIREINRWQFSQLFALSLITILLNGAKLRAITQSYNISLRFNEWFGLTAISLSLNSLLFKSGSLLASNYLKRAHHFPYMSYVGSWGADFLLMLFNSAIVGLAVTSYLAATSGKNYQLIITGFFLVILVLLLLMRSNIQIGEKQHKILDALSRALKSLNELLQNKQLLATLASFGAGLIIVTALRFYVASAILHYNIPLSHCFLFTAILTFVRNVPMIQSDIGMRELAVGLLSELLGSGLKEGFLISVVDRVFVLSWCLFFAGLYRNILAVQGKPAT
jgi:hypothetical protein